jgi:23S rRNA (uracil1939-C5)-methyltransferase
MTEKHYSNDPAINIELSINATAYGGKGVARLDGKVFFVSDTVEGDIVSAVVTEDHGRYANARLQSLKIPSPFRGTSPCVYSDLCGGCQWQGVSYEKQLEWKKSFVETSLARIGNITGATCEIQGSPSVQQYRNRILLRARINRDGRISFGYFQRGSRDFVPISKCLIADDAINVFLQNLLEIFAPLPASDELRFRFEVQALPKQKEDSSPHLVVTLHDTDDPNYPARDLARLFSGLPGVAWAGHTDKAIQSQFLPFEDDLDVSFFTSPGQFQQVNVALNRALRRLVCEEAEKSKPSSVLDVFCGSGNLSLPLAKRGITVTGVEFSKRAIECASFNCEKNHIKNATYESADTEKFLWRELKSGRTYDLVIADPPRDGMYKSLMPLTKLSPKTIIYVSCDPTTLARDLAALTKQGYKIDSIRAFDFFPNTYHVETVVVLYK